nr:ATP-binding protein [Paraglaciecola arctica]
MFFCILLSAILVLVIRRSLVPIQNLTEQVAKVEAGSLHNRLIEENVPTEITPLVDRLNQLLTRLEQSFLRERQFNSDLAHELQTPLAAIRTTSEVALKWPEQSSFDDYRYIAESTIQLQQTIDSLLTLARIESSGNETLSESVSVFTIVEECLSLHANSIEARGIDIILDVNRAQSLRSDPRLLRIILSNLLSNAADYAPENSEVTIAGDLLLNNQGTSNYQLNSTVLTVVNSAPNLTKGDLVTMFDRLWRKDSSRTGSKHVGLGLSIARTAAKALSLEITADLVEQSTPEQKIKMSLTVVDKKF